MTCHVYFKCQVEQRVFSIPATLVKADFGLNNRSCSKLERLRLNKSENIKDSGEVQSWRPLF